MTTKVQELLTTRESEYDRLSDEAVAAIGPIIDGIKEYIMLEEIAPENYELTISGMTMMPIDTSDDPVETSGAVMIGAMAVPPIGEKVTLQSGEVYEVTEPREQQVLGRAIRIVLKQPVLDANDQKATVQYLLEQTAKQKEMYERAMAAQEALEAQAAEDEAFAGLGDDSGSVELSPEERRDQEKLKKILEGAQNTSGFLN